MYIIKTIRAEIEKRLALQSLINGEFAEGSRDALNGLLFFLDTLQEQVRPDPYNPTYDEAYLNEKIKKASKTWKGVDVDKYMDEVRGREPEKPMSQDGLEEELINEADRKFFQMGFYEGDNHEPLLDCVSLEEFRGIARHFAQWGAEHSGSSEIPNDLKEAVKNYIYKAADSPGDDWTTDDIRNAYIAGAKWQADHTPLPEDSVLFNKGVEEGKRLIREDAVKWLVDDDYHEASEKGRFILGSVGLGYNGYYIPYSDLLKLPKEDEK